MTILRKIENPSGDNTGFVEKIQHENNVETNGVATSNYNDLKDKPLINGVILQGRLSLDDLYIQEKGDYAKANEIPTRVSELENDKGYVTEVPTKISELENDKNYITEYTETDPTIPQYIKNIKEEDIVSWNAKSEFSGNYDDLNNKPEIPSIAGLATEEYVNNAISKIPPTDLTGYATLDDVDDAITEIVGSAPETLDTLAELAEGLVANKNVVEVLNDAIVDKVNRTELHAVAMSGNYNDLINQPEGLATEQYVDDSMANIEIPKDYVYMETNLDSFVHGGDTVGFTRTENRTAFVQAIIEATAEYTKTGTIVVKDRGYHDYTVFSVIKNGSQNGKEKVAFKYMAFSPNSNWIGYPYKLYTGNGELLITTNKTWSSISMTSNEYDLDSFTTTTYVDNAISSAIGDIESLLGGI